MKGRAGFTEALLDWFRKNKRDLPWRRTRDPYAIWISEVMLQQTQIKTVLPYYREFLKKFPNVESLARAPLQKILKSWEGLGYYSRVRHLRSTACEVRGKYNGKFPGTRKALIELPGIGPYTASAIASIAFGEPTPVVDGNVWRVFSRILADSGSPEKGKKNVFRFLSTLIPAQDPSSFNQAVMELGSLVCTPKNPNCALCPVHDFCRAFKERKVDRFPKIQAKKTLPHRNWIALVVRHQNKVLLRQRPLRGIWGGLWEFPSIAVHGTRGLKKTAEKFARTFLGEISEPRKLEPLAHAFSHFKLTLHPFFLESQDRPGKNGHLAWIDIRKNRNPIPSPHLKILQSLQDAPP